MMRPVTGAPAPTIDHQPVARIRWSAGYTRMISASAVGWDADPHTWPTIRSPMSAEAVGAPAVARAAPIEPARPSRNNRRCPKVSPSLPNTGVHTAWTRNGPVMAQVRKLVDTP